MSSVTRMATRATDHYWVNQRQVSFPGVSTLSFLNATAFGRQHLRAEVKLTERTFEGGAIRIPMTGRRAVKLTQSPILQRSFVQAVNLLPKNVPLLQG